eukprot:8415-Heterococcus_DN1.PRE.3
MARTKRLDVNDDGTPLQEQAPASAAAAAAPAVSSATGSGSDSDPKKQGKGDRADGKGKKLHVGDALQYLDKVKEAFLAGLPSDPEQNYVKFLDIMKVGAKTSSKLRQQGVGSARDFKEGELDTHGVIALAAKEAAAAAAAPTAAASEVRFQPHKSNAFCTSTLAEFSMLLQSGTLHCVMF